MVELLLQHGSSTAVLDPAGQLYSCQQYHGCQSLIEARRGQHVRAVFSVLREGGSAGRDKLKSVFLVSKTLGVLTLGYLKVHGFGGSGFQFN